jgi:hypothetical protein
MLFKTITYRIVPEIRQGSCIMMVIQDLKSSKLSSAISFPSITICPSSA